MTERETLKLALEAYIKAGIGNSTDFVLQGKAYDLAVEALAQPEQEPVAWKPDRSGKYLTVVYRDVIPGDEVGAIVDHPKCVIMSWSNAVHDVEQLSNTTPPQRKPLTDEQIIGIAQITCIGISPHEDTVNLVRAIEAAHGIKE